MILDLFTNRYTWRDFDLGPGITSDESGTGDVYYAPPPSPPPSPQDSPPSYNPGPPPGRSYYNAPASSQKAAAQAAPDLWADVAGNVHDQAVSLVETFEKSLGWPKGIDANAAALGLAKSGMNITGNAFAAYTWLFWYAPGMTPDLQKNNPWAKYGLDQVSYQTIVNHFNSVYSNWTGVRALPGDVTGGALDSAIQESWTPDQIKNFAMFGNAVGSGPLLPQAQLSGTMPWLSQGQTYQQTLSGFSTFEGHTPGDSATLAAWFRFGVSAKQTSAAAEATGVARPAQTSSSLVR